MGACVCKIILYLLTNRTYTGDSPNCPQHSEQQVSCERDFPLCATITFRTSLLRATFYQLSHTKFSHVPSWISLSIYFICCSVTKLGPCCFCDGDVDVLNGYRAPCNHLVHYTCANLLSREISGRHNIDWSIVSLFFQSIEFY